jgi:hypothetical protein
MARTKNSGTRTGGATQGTVRAKFVLTAEESTMQNRYEKKGDGSFDYTKPIPKIMKTLKLSPVSYNSNEPDSENSKFWEATPMGSLSLGVINESAWKNFKLGKEYYVDFTPAN